MSMSTAITESECGRCVQAPQPHMWALRCKHHSQVYMHYKNYCSCHCCDDEQEEKGKKKEERYQARKQAKRKVCGRKGGRKRKGKTRKGGKQRKMRGGRKGRRRRKKTVKTKEIETRNWNYCIESSGVALYTIDPGSIPTLHGVLSPPEQCICAQNKNLKETKRETNSIIMVPWNFCSPWAHRNQLYLLCDTECIRKSDSPCKKPNWACEIVKGLRHLPCTWSTKYYNIWSCEHC